MEIGIKNIIVTDIAKDGAMSGINTAFYEKLMAHTDMDITASGGVTRLDDLVELINEAASKYGNQCVVLSVDVKRVDGDYHIFVEGGRRDTGILALSFIEDGIKRGAGEIVVNSIDTDGVKKGFDLELLRAVCDISPVPVIASGGAGKVEDFTKLFKEIPDISAGLAASIFHLGEVKIKDLKQELKAEGILVRI